LNGLHDEGCKTLGFQFAFQSLQVIERNGRGFREQRTKAFAPELVAHQRKSTTSQPMKCVLRAKNAGPSSVRSTKLDRRFHTLAPGGRKENLAKASARPLAQLLRQFSGYIRDVRLNHRRTTAI
jgi:hypothetical protein